jgi:hypothetical protein
MKPICSLFLAAFIASSAWAEAPIVTAQDKVPFTVVAVQKEDAVYALARLELAKPCLVLKEKVFDLDSAGKLMDTSLSYAHRMRIGRSGEWLFFPRIDIAKDDFTFKSGFAIKLGTSEVFRWGEKQK